MTDTTTYVIEGKYADDWEIIETVTPEDGGEPEAERLLGEHRIAAPYAPHRMRPARECEA